MSATLRAAALVAIPTAVISVLGIYWLQRRKKKDEIALISLTLSRRNSKSALEADGDDVTGIRETPELKSKCAVPKCNGEFNPADVNDSITKSSDRKSVENSINDNIQCDILCVDSKPNNVELIENSVRDSEQLGKSCNNFNAYKNKSTDVVADNGKDNEDFSSLIQAVQSVNCSLSDNTKHLPFDVRNTSSNTTHNRLHNSSDAKPVVNELTDKINITCESSPISPNVNRTDNIFDKSSSELDVSLSELSNDVFAENEPLVASVSFGCMSSLKNHVKEDSLDKCQQREEVNEKQSVESGCFVSYSSESVCDLDSDRNDSVSAINLDNVHQQERQLTTKGTRGLGNAIEPPKEQSQMQLKVQEQPETPFSELQQESQNEQPKTRALVQLEVQQLENLQMEEQQERSVLSTNWKQFEPLDNILEQSHKPLFEQFQPQEPLLESLDAQNAMWVNGSSPLASSGSSCSEPTGENLSAVSSDSGQGGSNGHATPPDTEPQTSLLTYEFDFPSELCGMLIGRNGRHINGISRDSGAVISVKQKPFVTEYQTVGLQGTHTQVYSALDTIKSRFPASKFPGISFESTVALGSPGLDIQLSQITLPEGGFVDVLVSSVVSLDRVFLQQSMHPSFPLLNYLNDCMWACYNQGGPGTALTLPQPVSANTLCVAPMFGGWFRAQVVETSEEESGQCLVRFVDYGGYCSLDVSALRQIRTDFTALPFQAIECFLNGITPPSPEDKSSSSVQAEGKVFLENLVRSKSLLAEVAGYSADGTPFVNLYQFYCDQMYSINEELLANTTLLKQQMTAPATYIHRTSHHSISS